MCIHHFYYEEANGPKSKGKCLKCGEIRKDRNSFNDEEELIWRRSPKFGIKDPKERSIDNELEICRSKRLTKRQR